MFLSGIFGIVGAIGGATIGYYFSLKVAETQVKYAERLALLNARLVAGAKLRAAFTPGIAKYNLLFRKGERKAKGAVARLLEDSLPKHAAAIEEYGPFVPPQRWRAYQEAWENYHNPLPEAEIDFAFWAYEDDPEFFKESIQKILKFTEAF